MTYVCLRQRATAKVCCLLLFAAALLTGIFSSLELGPKGIWQILMVASLVAIIQISQRYLLSGYEYILDPMEEILLHNRITVIRTQGKRRTSIFTVPLKNLTAVISYVKYKKLKEEYGEISERMNFCADMFPSESYLLLFEVNDKISAVRLQCGADFAEELKKRAGV